MQGSEKIINLVVSNSLNYICIKICTLIDFATKYMLSTCINHVLDVKLSFLQVTIINMNQTFANNCLTLEQHLKDDIQGEFFLLIFP